MQLSIWYMYDNSVYRLLRRRLVSYKNLEIWQESRTIVVDIPKISRKIYCQEQIARNQQQETGRQQPETNDKEPVTSDQ